jgi:hypothetical protein
MKAQHEHPTLYYVGPAFGELPTPTAAQEAGPHLVHGIIAAEYPEGVGGPRYLYFTDMLDLRAYVRVRQESAELRGSDYAFLWGGPEAWAPDDLRSTWAADVLYIGDQLTKAEVAFFRQWINKDRRYRDGGRVVGRGRGKARTEEAA